MRAESSTLPHLTALSPARPTACRKVPADSDTPLIPGSECPFSQDCPTSVLHHSYPSDTKHWWEESAPPDAAAQAASPSSFPFFPHLCLFPAGTECVPGDLNSSSIPLLSFQFWLFPALSLPFSASTLLHTAYHTVPASDWLHPLDNRWTSTHRKTSAIPESPAYSF